MRRVTRTRVSPMTIHRHLKERSLSSYRPLRHLLLTLAYSQARLQWILARSYWNHADWRCIVFSDESRFQLCPDEHRRRVWRRPRQCADSAFTIAHHTGSQPVVMQDKARPHTARVAMNCLTACQTLPRPARSPDLSPIKRVLDMMGRRLHLLGNIDDLPSTIGANLARNTPRRPSGCFIALYQQGRC
ncbi:transposable element Tc1 transposase [Trichonephila clavipes]|uniref:Transposable element Tc1 transposase n=1 Tax=Trichonephila clavipes TaxID=2585209 RepID=A0A8X6V2T4_TRICX|nr:transposable element Tc1 transposase [Trichonephila clavipes]